MIRLVYYKQNTPSFLSSIIFFGAFAQGSMKEGDGSMLEGEGEATRLVPSCSRWSELTSAAKFYIEFSHAACAPSQFRFLNAEKPIVVGAGDVASSQRGVDELKKYCRLTPTYKTPLVKHIRAVAAEIRQIEVRSKTKNSCI